MAANSHFLALLPKQATEWNVAYFLFILVSLVSIGGVLEARREFLLLEAIRLIATAAAVLAGGVWFGSVRDARIIGIPFVVVAQSFPCVGQKDGVAISTHRLQALYR